MPRSLVLTVLLLCVGRGAASAADPLLAGREQQALLTLFAEYFLARLQSDYRGMAKAYEALEKKMDATAKGKKVDTLLVSPADLRAIYGAPVEPEKRIKKGFFDEKDGLVPLAAGKESKFEYLIRLPRDYRPDVATPTIVTLHPDMDRLDLIKKWAQRAFPDAVADVAIIVIPLNYGPNRTDWTTLEGRMISFFSLRDVFKKYAVDRLHTFLEGHGGSSEAAVRYAIGYPGMFSGIVLRGLDAEPPSDLFVNIRNVPILTLAPESGDEAQIINSFVDAAKAAGVETKVVTTVIEEDGFPGESGAAAIVEALTGPPKNPTPKKLKFTTSSTEFINVFWLHLTSLEVSPEKPVTVEAEIVSESNEIHVKTPPNVTGFTVYLNDDLVDMGKTIKLVHTVVDGDTSNSTVRFEGTKVRSFEKSLTNWFEVHSGNFGEVYTNTIEVEVPQQ